MSEVKPVHRYKAQTLFSFGGAKIEYFPHGPEVVLATEFDAQRLRADTAEAERDALRYKAELYDEVWADATGRGYANVTMALCALAAAEQRIAQHEGMLRHFASCADARQVGTSAMDYVAALNPKPEAGSHE